MGCGSSQPATLDLNKRSSGRMSEITKIGGEWTGQIPAEDAIASSKEPTPAVGGAGAALNGSIPVLPHAQDAAMQPETGKAAEQQQLHSAEHNSGALQNGGISTSSHAPDAAVQPETGKAAAQQQLHAARHTSDTPATNIAAAAQSTEALALTLQPHPAHVNGVATPPAPPGSSPPATPTKPDSVPREPERDYQPDEDLGDLAFPAAAGVEGESGSPKKAPVAAAIAAINAGAAASPRRTTSSTNSATSSPPRRASGAKRLLFEQNGVSDEALQPALSRAQQPLPPPLPPLPPSGFPARLQRWPAGQSQPAWAVPKLGADNPAAVWIEDDPGRASALQPLLAAFHCTPTPTSPDRRFDGLARTAAAFFDMPIAMVMFMDDWYAYLVGTHGAAMDFTERRCNVLPVWALASMRPEVVVIPDCSTDGRVKDHPLVRGAPKLRFMAAAPIVLPDGHRLGALCLLDRRWRAFEPQQAIALAHFAELVGRDAAHIAAAAAAPSVGPAPAAKDALQLPTPPPVGGAALIDVSEPSWPVLHPGEAFSAVAGLAAGDTAQRHFWQLFTHFSGRQGQEAADACAPGVGRGSGFSLEVQRSGADDARRFSARFVPASADRLDSAAANIAVPLPSALPPDTDAASPPATPFYFVTLEQVASAEAPYIPSPAASPRSPRRSTRRGSGLALEPAPRGPPWGDQVALGPLLGRGSASKVFRGLRGGRPVAIKVVEGEGTHEALTSARERLESLSLTHPNVARMLAVGTQHMPARTSVSRFSSGLGHGSPHGSPNRRPRGSSGDHAPGRMQTWIVLELAHLGSLQLAIDCGRFRTGDASLFAGGPDMAAILAAATDVASAMAHLHSQGVLHGALRAGNVLLTAQRRYQVADYALQELTCSAGTSGRRSEAAHLPPETLQGGGPTRAGDVYAFGVLLWQLYTSEQPFAGQTPQAVAALKCRSPPWRLVFPPGTPVAFQVLAEACMSADPAQRPVFDSIVQHLAQLTDALQGGVLPSPQPFAAYQKQLAAPP